ncbi:Fusaric acid resistance protein-like-domain-containing protein [Cubamyces lactineus]|nr:Fusaric acid resistance protein-like-domain-containing protein [Cubamyces lactineus]
MEDEARMRASAPRTPGTIRSTKPNTPHAVNEGVPSYFDRAPSALANDRDPSVDRPLEATEYRLGSPLGRAPDCVPEESDGEDEYEDSDTATEHSTQDASVSASASTSRSRWYSLLKIPRIPPLTPVQRNILKCCIAYFIGSLFTFSPYLSGFIADITSDDPGDRTPSPSGHMVATVAVYFNPAKTLGGMIEADVFCLMGLLFATVVSLSSMSVYWFFELQPGWEWLADSLVILMIGLGMSMVAWMKVWMAKPTFNTACSMTAIILFVVVIKEGGLQTLMQVSFIVIVGSLISNVVCLLIWPQRATTNLQNNMTQTLNSFSTLLGMLTQTFLLEEPHGFGADKLQRAVSNHQASFTSLKKSLDEARSERFFGGPGRVGDEAQLRGSSGQAYQDAIDSLNRLGQHLNGLRSGISLQHEIIRGYKEGKIALRNATARLRPEDFSTSTSNGKRKVVDPNCRSPSMQAMQDEEAALLQAAATAFGDLMDDLGPPLKALSTACTSTLKRLREAFAHPRDNTDKTTMRPADFHALSETVERALFTFESTSNHAVVRLYRSGNISGFDSRASIASLTSDNQVFAGDESENVFLVYFYIFTLQEFARELISLVDAMGRVCSIERANAAHNGLWGRFRDAMLLSCGSRSAIRRTTREKRSRSIRKRLSALFVNQQPHRAVSFPKVTPHAPNTIQTPARENLTFIGRVKQSLWALGARLKQQDMKYAFKTGMATAILAAPAFFEVTRPVFVEYRGEWALISFFVVISPTIGATNYMGVHRVLGTLFGAATAFVVWTLFPENAWVLAIFGFFYSIPCFYYIIAKPQYATSARFVLLTYNLTCLFCYNLREKDVAVFDIAFHRAVAVTVGVVWAAIVSRYWWPAEARRELSRALGEFCLNMGWLYTRLVAFNSFSDHDIQPQTIEEEPSPTEETRLLRVNPALSHSIQHFMAMELHLQIKLIELQGLLSQTQHEPRLKGPFPVALYRSILTSLQTILDRLHSMRCVTSREEWCEALPTFILTVRRDFIIPVNKERREMVGNVILYFSTLAAAFRLKSPLPPYLPPAENSRQRLVDAIRKLEVVRSREVKGSRHLLFFAYALTMKAVIQELDYLGRTLQDAFGVIGQSREAFEALFEDRPDATTAV